MSIEEERTSSPVKERKEKKANTCTSPVSTPVRSLSHSLFLICLRGETAVTEETESSPSLLLTLYSVQHTPTMPASQGARRDSFSLGPAAASSSASASSSRSAPDQKEESLGSSSLLASLSEDSQLPRKEEGEKDRPSRTLLSHSGGDLPRTAEDLPDKPKKKKGRKPKTAVEDDDKYPLPSCSIVSLSLWVAHSL